MLARNHGSIPKSDERVATFRSIRRAALGLPNSILAIRNSTLGMASHNLSNTVPAILGATPVSQCMQERKKETKKERKKEREKEREAKTEGAGPRREKNREREKRREKEQLGFWVPVTQNKY